MSCDDIDVCVRVSLGEGLRRMLGLGARGSEQGAGIQMRANKVKRRRWDARMRLRTNRRDGD